MSRKKKLLIGASVVVLLGAVAYANVRFKRTDGVTVHTETVQARQLEAIVTASGKIRPKRQVNVSSDTMGRVTDLRVNEGDRVERGQFLLQIDPRTARTRVQSSEAGVQAARSQADQLRLSLEATRTALKQAEDNLKRQQELWKGGLTTREMLERSEHEVSMRRAELQAQEQQIRTQQLRMEQEQASLESARYDLSRVRIDSPIAGIVTRRNIEEGETVVVGTMNNPGTVLLTVADLSVIEAEVDVDETDIPSVQIGQPATVTIDAMPGRTFTATVTEIGNSPIQQATGAQTSVQATNFKVVLTIDGEIPDVRPGFTCTAEITTATRDSAVAVPIQATTVREMVVDEQGQIVREPATDTRRGRSGSVQAAELKPGQTYKELEGVFVVRDGKAIFEPVEVGIHGERYFEVLSGLTAGDMVITGPFASVRELRDGAPVKAEAAPRGPGRPRS